MTPHTNVSIQRRLALLLCLESEQFFIVENATTKICVDLLKTYSVQGFSTFFRVLNYCKRYKSSTAFFFFHGRSHNLYSINGAFVVVARRR